ncbi:MAG: hypothetical protein J2P37_23990, partial [Ktedonobacteraceae bacterium]|nr:hypothetical protein [Ktedonobacteraceae bacterium]
KASTVVAAIRLERAVPVCEQLSESTAGELLTRMPLEKAARVWKAIDVEKAVDVLLYLEERDARGQELATNLLTRANEISAEETAGRLARWKTVIKKNKLFTGLTILLSTAVSGAIDQVQPAIQHRGVDAAVLSLYGSGLGASFLVGNLFFRWATTKELPQWVPFLGGKPLASSANAYQIAFAVGWATVGAATELIVRPYLLGPLTHRGG